MFIAPSVGAQTTPLCEKNSECPAYLGQIIVQDEATHQPSVCSTFLVRNQYLVTNRHCLPAELRKAGASCKSIRVEFPKTPDFQNEVVTCEEVVNTSDQFAPPLRWATDMAVLKLQRPVNRALVELSTEPIRAGDRVQIFKVDPPPAGKSTPVLRKRGCEVMPTLINPFFTKDLAPELTLKDCGVIGGNSGSPVLNQKGQVAGIVWGGGKIQVSGDAKAEAVGAGFVTPFHCFQPSAALILEPTSKCKLELSPQELTLLEKEYHQRKSAHQDVTDQQKKQMQQSFVLFQKKMKEALNGLDGAEQRAAFGWASQEVQLREEETKTYWGRQIAVPTCVHLQYLKAVAEKQKLSLAKLRLAYSVPVVNFVRVSGDPELFFTSLVDAKLATMSADISQPVVGGGKTSFSYQFEVATGRTELKVLELLDCEQVQGK